MSFNNIVSNGGFETGLFSPWTAFDATISAEFSHSGFFSARYAGGMANSFIFQYVPVEPEIKYKFFVSLAKVGIQTGPFVSVSVSYHDANYNFVGNGLIINIPSGRLPNVNENNWLEIYHTTDPVPAEATQALITVNKLPLSDSADIVVDDINLLKIETIFVPTGPFGI